MEANGLLNKLSSCFMAVVIAEGAVPTPPTYIPWVADSRDFHVKGEPLRSSQPSAARSYLGLFNLIPTIVRVRGGRPHQNLLQFLRRQLEGVTDGANGIF